MLTPETNATFAAGYGNKGTNLSVMWYQPFQADTFIDGYIQRINTGDQLFSYSIDPSDNSMSPCGNNFVTGAKELQLGLTLLSIATAILLT